MKSRIVICHWAACENHGRIEEPEFRVAVSNLLHPKREAKDGEAYLQDGIRDRSEGLGLEIAL